MNTSPRTSTSGGWPEPLRRCGMPVTRRALIVTSSPTRPSPRVAAEVSTPSSYRRLMASPSIFNSVSQRTGRPADACALRHQSRSSSSLKTLSRLSIRSACSTGANIDDSAAPTERVGESWPCSSGWKRSISSSRRIHPS